MKRLTACFFYLLLLSLVLLYLAPIAMMVMASFKPDPRVLVEAGSLRAFLPEDISLQNYQDVLQRVSFVRYLFNSLLITAAVVGAGLLVNALAGYATARLEWRGRRLFLAAVMALLIIPFEAIAVPLFYETTLLGWRDTYIIQIVPFIANAFSIYLFHTFFLSLPRELDEAAQIDGAGTLRIFFSIIAPNAKPAFAAVAVLNFLTQWGAFLWPLMVTSGPAVRPLPVGIAEFYTLPPLQWGDIMAFAMMMVTPVVLVFIFFQRWFIQGIAATGIRQ